MRLAIWIVGLTALATSLDSAYGDFYGRAIARMLTDMANGFDAISLYPIERPKDGPRPGSAAESPG